MAVKKGGRKVVTLTRPNKTPALQAKLCEAEASLTSEDELSENSKPNVNTATTTSASGGKEKRKGRENIPFHLSAFMFMKNVREQ